MKRKIMIVLVVFSTIGLYAQFEKGSIFISLDGNYIKSGTESGVTTNLNQTNGEYLNVGTSIGKFISPNIMIELGLDYQKGNETRLNKLDFNEFVQQEVMTTKSKIILPNLYVGYYKQLVNRLYFNTTLKISVGTIESDYSTNYAGLPYLKVPTSTSTSTSGSYARYSSKSEEADYLGVEISPGLTYFVSKRVGFTLNLGGIGYSMMDGKTESASWIVNFNPNYWKFGVKVKI